MLIKKEIITSLVFVFSLLGCNGTTGSNEEGNIAVVQENNEAISQRPTKEAAVETKPENWYIRLTAEDPTRGMKTQSTQLGQLDVPDAVEKHTLKALSPFGGAYLDIVFRNPTGVGVGDYKVNFHTYVESSEDSWEFTVRTDDSNADILLSWRGVYVLSPYIDDQDRQRYKEYRSVSNPIIENMKLIDVNDGTEIAAVIDGKVQTYAFNMGGVTERTFQWVVQIDKVLLSAIQPKMSTLQANSLKVNTTVDQIAVQAKKSAMFDITHPPMVKEDMNGQ